jgi:hypothetical protein
MYLLMASVFLVFKDVPNQGISAVILIANWHASMNQK